MAESVGAEDSGFNGVENHSALAKALESLSERDRTIVRLRFVDGLSQSQIAARLGVSQMQISRLLAASLRQLRANIDAKE
jgi:RNA polymerase sigma-B factor